MPDFDILGNNVPGYGAAPASAGSGFDILAPNLAGAIQRKPNGVQGQGQPGQPQLDANGQPIAAAGGQPQPYASSPPLAGILGLPRYGAPLAGAAAEQAAQQPATPPSAPLAAAVGSGARTLFDGLIGTAN